jgi:hypothetical protein
VEDDPTSTTVCDRALGPTQCGISDVATKCTKGGRKPNICRCMLGAVLSWRCLGRHRLRCQPCSRIGENPPYGMIGGIEETSASSKPDPRLDPTRLRGALSNERPYRDLRNVAINYPLVRAHRFAGIQPNSGRRDYSRLSCAAGEMPLGPRAAGIFSKRCAPKWPSSGIVRRELAAVSADPKMLRRRPNQQYHCALCAGLWAQRERVW